MPTKPRRINLTPLEDQEQETIFQWADLMMSQYPELEYMYHVPNGGARSKATAARLKRQGVRAGVPDIVLPVARMHFCGLYIELKRIKGGKVSEEQKKWLAYLNRAGYLAVECKGADEAIEAITNYLKGEVSK